MQEKWIIEGPRTLSGEVRISGMKNAALPIIFACLLNPEPCMLYNVPDVTDVHLSMKILQDAGAEVTRLGKNQWRVHAKCVSPGRSHPEDVQRLRASTYLMGTELGRCGKTEVARPGGCNFADRPVDQHIKAFEALGALNLVGQDTLSLVASDAGPGRLKGGTIIFDLESVGATCNAIMASALAEGTTIIEGAAREPHIVDLANFLNECGADIKGAGTSVIRINGKETLHGCTYTVESDMIEAGTFLALVSSTGGDVLLRDVIPQHLTSMTSKLRDMGVILEESENSIRVISTGKIGPSQITAKPYPAFPTDMQPQFVSILATAQGSSIVKDDVYPTRFQYTAELEKMGASIKVENGAAYIKGVKQLKGAAVNAQDLRAGAALLIAALRAAGKTELTGVDKIARGYEDFVEKLNRLGADIRIENNP
ncbi:MAG: UDP-N-acetylglucosamine 1-carboxyvinyltransferase [Clostridia bacterium]|nr:UDP-N-acetylglucosamine 1-carboxyvinyltransferase [Clostridia bacterium]